MMHVGVVQDVPSFTGTLFIFIFFLLIFKMYNLCSLILYSVNSDIVLNTSSEFLILVIYFSAPEFPFGYF